MIAVKRWLPYKHWDWTYRGVKPRTISVSSPLKIADAHIGHTIRTQDHLSRREIRSHAHAESKGGAQGGGSPCVQRFDLPLEVFQRVLELSEGKITAKDLSLLHEGVVVIQGAAVELV